MANRYAVANGNWSSLATWDGGVSLPGVGDVVRPNTYTVTIDQNVTVGTLINNASSPAAAGGSFVVSASGFTITADLTMAGAALLTFSHSGTLSIVGNITTALVVQVSNSGCILITSTGTLTVTGNVSTSTNFQTHSAIRSTTNCTVNITGNVSGAGTTSSLYINYGVFLSGAATLSITGSATNADWGYAVSALNASSVVTITGNVACSSVNTECVAFGGTLLVNGTVSTAGYAALFGNDVGTATLAGSVIATTGTAGQFWANRLRVLITPSASQSMGMLTSSFASRSLYTGGTNIGQPSTANVRSGTAFGASSEYTGTLAVPSPTLVAIGVSTDNTVGSYAPTGGLDAAGVRTAIGLATANLDTQLSGIQSDTNDIQTRLPAALESGRIAAALDSATAAKIDAILEDTGTTLPAAIAGIDAGGSGTGARTVTITVNDGTTALQNATVRMTEGANTFTALTNVSGVAVFNLDDATYTVGVTKSGYSYAGATLIVNGAETATYSMTVVSITPPSNPSLSAIVVLCLDAAGQPEASVAIDIRIVTVPSGSQNIAYKGAKQTATSNVNGIAQFEVVQGSVCEWKRGKADVWSSVTIDSDSVTNVTSVIGSP